MDPKKMRSVSSWGRVGDCMLMLRTQRLCNAAVEGLAHALAKDERSVWSRKQCREGICAMSNQLIYYKVWIRQRQAWSSFVFILSLSSTIPYQSPTSKWHLTKLQSFTVTFCLRTVIFSFNLNYKKSILGHIQKWSYENQRETSREESFQQDRMWVSGEQMTNLHYINFGKENSDPKMMKWIEINSKQNWGLYFISNSAYFFYPAVSPIWWWIIFWLSCTDCSDRWALFEISFQFMILSRLIRICDNQYLIVQIVWWLPPLS